MRGGEQVSIQREEIKEGKGGQGGQGKGHQKHVEGGAASLISSVIMDGKHDFICTTGPREEPKAAWVLQEGGFGFFFPRGKWKETFKKLQVRQTLVYIKCKELVLVCTAYTESMAGGSTSHRLSGCGVSLFRWGILPGRFEDRLLAGEVDGIGPSSVGASK